MTESKQAKSLYPAIEPYNIGRLPVSQLHTIVYEEVGNPAGRPALFLHGQRSDYVKPGHHAVIHRLFPAAEIEAARSFYRRSGFSTIDVTDSPIEATADQEVEPKANFQEMLHRGADLNTKAPRAGQESDRPSRRSPRASCPRAAGAGRRTPLARDPAPGRCRGAGAPCRVPRGRARRRSPPCRDRPPGRKRPESGNGRPPPRRRRGGRRPRSSR